MAGNNEILLKEGKTLTLSHKHGGGAGELDIALRGPQDFIAHMLDCGEVDGQMYDWADSFFFVNCDEKFLAFGMPCDYYYDSYDVYFTGLENVTYRDENELDGRSFWRDYLTTLYELISSVWQGWEVFIISPDLVDVSSGLPSKEFLEKSSFDWNVNPNTTISLSAIHAIIFGYSPRFFEHYDFIDNDSILSILPKNYDWHDYRGKFNKEVDELTDLFTEFIGLDESLDLKKRMTSNEHFLKERDRTEKKFNLLAVAVQKMLPKVKITRDYLSHPRKQFS